MRRSTPKDRKRKSLRPRISTLISDRIRSHWGQGSRHGPRTIVIGGKIVLHRSRDKPEVRFL